jgi:hypothetical protein
MMNGPLDPAIGEAPLYRTMPAQRVTAPNLATFARALRQRGLLARVDSLPSISEGWSDVPDLWIAGNAIYEAHLRRVGMEQVFATLRRDSDEVA